MSADATSRTMLSSHDQPSEDRPASPVPKYAPSDFLSHLPPSTEGPSDAPIPTLNEEPSTHTSAPNHTGLPPRPLIDEQGRALNPRSCVTCRKRKVKCDRLYPCTNCNKAHIECVFPAPGRAPRKPRKPGDGRDKELLERLRRLEGVVKGMGVDMPPGSEEKQSGVLSDDKTPDDEDSRVTSRIYTAKPKERELENAGDDTQMVSEHSEETEHQKKTRWLEEQQQTRFENRFGRLVINEGRSRYINNSFWANLSNEVEDLKGILNQDSDDEDEELPNADAGLDNNHQGWVFGFSSQNVDLLSLHPLPNQIVHYWEAYKDRVDPLVKVLHIPTIEGTILSAASHLTNLSKGFETLLFAIYYGATTSLSAQDCLLKFGEEKPILLSRYRFALEQALARANFLTTEEAVVLQAFVIFLICLRRNNNARVIWTLTGLVVRIAQTIGIHRDGSHFDLPPFEVEMRRRLWWQVCLLDIRASEDHGCDPTIVEQSFDTRMPLNINDADIKPGMTEFPAERQGCTDMSFCLIRFEVANTFRRINYVPPGASRPCQEHFASVTLEDKERWITECHQRLEERYLKHCDMSVPLFWVTATVSRLMMSKMWLMVYHPFQRQDGGASLPSETKEKLFITSLENIEYALLLETEARTMKWGWLFRTYMQWHALAFMLSELCHRTSGDLVERAWVAVEKSRDGRWGDALADDIRAGHLWRPLKKIYRKAKEARMRGLQEEQAAKAPALTRRYSPNANPMFGHPRRPQVTRAPLSAAQVQRFMQGPTYGQMPLDKHVLLKSPKISEAVGSAETDPMDMAGLENSIGSAQPKQVSQQHNLPLQFDGVGPVSGSHPSFVPGADGSVDPTVSSSLFSPANNIAFGTSPSASMNFPPASASGSMPRLDSIDSNFELDPSIMDTPGQMNWENWDQLVRQFGMDVDQTFDIRADTAPANGWSNEDMNMMSMNGFNSKMGMGGSDWF
ncbi:hypothetical protein D0860_01367 [Hortaea werneckii]|uniref:Zn(2)-C6 fungal-type domain-containing protein n=1 Tax=Hortaea werneckii TaxID=91943 RepID=A0A3M7HS23_HORWE|nr:hypothetical protein D0860_01367 [Hortaea werneckii]